MDGHQVGTLPQPQRGEKTGNAEHVVEMAMRQQQAIQSAESGAAPEQLALRALPAIDHDAAATRLNQKARVIAIGGRNAGGRPEKGQIEHREGTSPLFVSPTEDFIAPAPRSQGRDVRTHPIGSKVADSRRDRAASRRR
jgi:hypothetical protein